MKYGLAGDGELQYLPQLSVEVDSSGEKIIVPENTISSEEYSFAQLIMRFQRRFAQGLKASFITHLKLRQLWNEYNLKDQDIEINFTPPALYDIFHIHSNTT